MPVRHKVGVTAAATHAYHGRRTGFITAVARVCGARRTVCPTQVWASRQPGYEAAERPITNRHPAFTARPVPTFLTWQAAPSVLFLLSLQSVRPVSDDRRARFNFIKMKRTGNFFKIVFTVLLANLSLLTSHAADRFVPFRYGNFDTWVVRHVHESAVIGGNDKTLYEPGPARELTSNNPYVNLGGSPWGTSNVMAKVMGIVKTNVSVYRDAHGAGHCAKLVTHIETCKVLGLMNIKVLAAGSIFLGDVREPITGTKDGPKALNWGIPFTLRPKAVRFDYRVETPASRNRIRQNGFSKATAVAGPDYCTAVLYLQKRHEGAKGNITAQRVGTMVVHYGQSTKGWVDGATYEIHYGNITAKPFYDAATMGLRSTDYARNSKGESVIVHETGWAASGETPTHIILQFSSSHGGAYVGTPGNTLWIDNVGLVY